MIQTSHLEIFCRQVRARSDDHREAVVRLHHGGPPSQIVSILRQELDSMIRVIYLLSISDMAYREQLIKASIEGRKWTHKGSRRRITDRDYRERDPMDSISDDEKKDILNHMRSYHGGPRQTNPNFKDLLPYLPMVFDKIASNLEHHLGDLEAGRVI